MFDQNITIEKFLTDSELADVMNWIENLPDYKLSTDYNQGIYKYDTPATSYFSFFMHNNRQKNIARDILMPKLLAQFGDNLVVNDSHLLYSYIPYGVHNDVDSGGYADDRLDTSMVPAWTLIIPLETYDSCTVTFHQKHEIVKIPGPLIEDGTLTKLSNHVDAEFAEKYLKHTVKLEHEYLSVENTFKWNKGSLYASDRRKFHCSDCHDQNGVPMKSAIVLWTSIRV